MILRYSIFILLSFVILLSSEKIMEERSLSRQKRKLMFSQYTSLSLTMAIVSQISYIPSHRVAVNTGFSISYNLPFKPSNFYIPPFWGRSDSNVTSLWNKYFNKIIESNNKAEENEETTDTSSDTKELSKKVKRDLSAGEFYHMIKETIEIAGYHQDCLLKSVCELAKHPLAEYKDNLMAELLHYILTPSVHNKFESDEKELKKVFEDAEKFGKIGGDCDLMYEECEISPLHKMSNFVTVEN